MICSSGWLLTYGRPSLFSDVNLRALPKIELHLHLDCCLSYEAVRRLAPEAVTEAFRGDTTI
jgi:hypothetical protein